MLTLVGLASLIFPTFTPSMNRFAVPRVGALSEIREIELPVKV
jgi:hypothetical protein